MNPAEYKAEFASGVRATLIIDAAGARVEWDPALPVQLRGQQRRRFLQAYRAWRNECLADYARRSGGTVALIEL